MIISQISFILLMTNFFPVATPLDICVKHGVLREVSKIQIRSSKPVEVNLDIGNFNRYLTQINADLPKFLENLNQLSDIEQIKPLTSDMDELKTFSGLYNAHITNGKPTEGSKECGKMGKALLNLDDPSSRPAALKFMRENNINQSPIFALVGFVFIINRKGVVLGKIPDSADPEIVNAAVYPILKVDNTLDFENPNISSSNGKIICISSITPLKPLKGRQSYTNTWTRLTNKVITIASKIKPYYDVFSSMITALPTVSAGRSNSLTGTPQFALISLAKFLSTHQFKSSLQNGDFNVLQKLNEIIPTLNKLVAFLQPKRGKFTLDSDLINLDENFENIQIQGKQTSDHDQLILGGRARLVNNNSSFLITQYKFFPYQNNKSSFKPGYLIAKSADSISTGSNIFYSENFSSIGANCNDETDIRICEKYSPGFVLQNQFECAKSILDKTHDNKCDKIDSRISAIRTDCGEIDKSIIKISTPIESSVDIRCNNNYVKTHIINPGVHQLETDCAIYFDNNLLVPQIFRDVESRSSYERVLSSNNEESFEFKIPIF